MEAKDTVIKDIQAIIKAACADPGIFQLEIERAKAEAYEQGMMDMQDRIVKTRGAPLDKLLSETTREVARDIFDQMKREHPYMWELHRFYFKDLEAKWLGEEDGQNKT